MIDECATITRNCLLLDPRLPCQRLFREFFFHFEFVDDRSPSAQSVGVNSLELGSATTKQFLQCRDVLPIEIVPPSFML